MVVVVPIHGQPKDGMPGPPAAAMICGKICAKVSSRILFKYALAFSSRDIFGHSAKKYFPPDKFPVFHGCLVGSAAPGPNSIQELLTCPPTPRPVGGGVGGGGAQKGAFRTFRRPASGFGIMPKKNLQMLKESCQG